MTSIKQEQDDNRVYYNVDENQREQRNQMSEQVGEPRITKKDVDMLKYEHELLTQKLDNKKLAIKAATLEEEKAALEEERKVLTLKNEKLATEKTVIQNEKHTLQDEKKSLLDENQTLLYKCQNLQDEKKKLEKEKESMNVKYERLQNENLWIKEEMQRLWVIAEQNRNTLSSSPGEADLSESFSSHTKQLEEKIEKILKEKMDQLHEASSKKSAENMKQIQNMFTEKLKDTEQKLCADQEKHAKDEEARISALKIEIETLGNNISRHKRLNDKEASVESDKESDQEVCKIDDADCKNDDVESEDDESSENATPVCNEDTISEEISDEVSFPIHDKKIDHISICRVRGEEILVTASGRAVKITRARDGIVLKTFIFQKSVTSISAVMMAQASPVLVCGCQDSSITFLSLGNYEEINSFNRQSPILRMSLKKNNGRYLLACALKSGRLELFDVRETRCLSTLSNVCMNFDVFEMFRSGDDNKLYLALGVAENRVDICSLDDGRNHAQVIASLPIKCQTINSFCTFIHDGETCMAAGGTHRSGLCSIMLYKFSDSDVHFDNFIRSEYLENGIDHLKPITLINGSLMLLSHSAYSDSIYLWDVTTRELIRKIIPTHEAAVIDTFIDTYGGTNHYTLASGSSDGVVMLWDIKHKRGLRELNSSKKFDFDKSSNDEVSIESNFNIHDGQKIEHVIVTKIGNLQILVTASGHIVKVTNVEDGKLLWTSTGGRKVSCMTTILMQGLSLLALGYYDGTIVFHCLRTFKEISSHDCNSPIYRMSTGKTNNGMHLLSCGLKNGKIQLWDAFLQREMRSIPTGKENPIALEIFRYDNKLHLATAGIVEADVDIYCVEDDENKLAATLSVQSKRIYSLCTFVQKKETFITVGTHGQQIMIYKMNSKSFVRTITSNPNLKSLKFLQPVTLNGSLTLMGTYINSISFWDISSRKLVHMIDADQELMSLSSCKNIEDTTIAAGSIGGMVLLHRVSKGGNIAREKTCDSIPDRRSKRTRYE